jgi:hypothetical protein
MTEYMICDLRLTRRCVESFDLTLWTRITRERLGLRQSSGAPGPHGPIESARGLAQSKTLRHFGRLMKNRANSKSSISA